MGAPKIVHVCIHFVVGRLKPIFLITKLWVANYFASLSIQNCQLSFPLPFFDPILQTSTLITIVSSSRKDMNRLDL